MHIRHTQEYSHSSLKHVSALLCHLQGVLIPSFKTQKLLKTNTAVWFNKLCRVNHLTSFKTCFVLSNCFVSYMLGQPQRLRQLYVILSADSIIYTYQGRVSGSDDWGKVETHQKDYLTEMLCSMLLLCNFNIIFLKVLYLDVCNILVHVFCCEGGMECFRVYTEVQVVFGTWFLL